MGTFFEFNGCRYLITAAHVLKQHGLESVGVPENASRGSIRTFGRCTIRRPRLDDYDVAVVKLEDPELLSFVSPYWRFLGLSNVGSNHFGRPHYLVAGYPEEFIQYCGSDLGPSGLLIVDTEPYTGKPENENGSGDFYLKYGEQARNLAKTIVASPTLPGLSGTSVWKAFGREGNDSIWTVEANIRVVGVQCAYHPRAYIRVASWWIAQRLIKDFDTVAAEEISHVLRGTS
ncbi:MAG TPA: hypothetical protein VJA26_07985 [Gammaproteobacteria bacterium]|nr:hypothetical protein [Gammaproteobacteria bacterium]